MDQDVEVLSGYLLLPPCGIVFNKITKKKNWQQKYCILYRASKQGIERLEIYDNKEDVANGIIPRIITLENCIKITDSSPNTITIFTKTLTQHMSVLTEAESSEWVTALQSVAFKDVDCNSGGIDEDNDLYCSSGEGVFSVKLFPSDASRRCGFEPVRYVLVLTVTALELRDVNDNKLCATWPYRYIRRYGYRQGKFTFEAGRKCETGEGTFHLEHSNQHEIFRCLSMKMKSMKQMMSTDSLHSPDHSECHFQAAISNMEAGSRSPLLPAARTDDLNLSSMSLKSNSMASTPISSVDSSTSLLPSGPKPALKPKPQKPPRKNIFTVAKEKHENDFTDDGIDFGKYRKMDNYEPIAPKVEIKEVPDSAVSYDKVEIRSEAWKTLGLDDIDHNEFTPNLSAKGKCMKLISRSQDNLNSPGADSSRIILLPSPVVDPEDENYDRLEYFGSTSRLDTSRYKKIEARPTTLQINERKDPWNDYDEVENVMQTARLADDSHLGYGMIRKPSIPGPQVPTNAQVVALQNQVNLDDINHREFNGTEYAIVSRPKRV